MCLVSQTFSISHSLPTKKQVPRTPYFTIMGNHEKHVEHEKRTELPTSKN